jgi:hypothetical protein
LRPPTDYCLLISISDPSYTLPNIPPTSLLYSCPPPGDANCEPDIIVGTSAARSEDQPERPYGFTLMLLCDIAFSESSFYEIEAWLQNIEESILATTLLYEMQHADEVVGLDQICEDYAYHPFEYKTLYSPI